MFIEFWIINPKHLFIFLTPIIWKIDIFLGDSGYNDKFYHVFINNYIFIKIRNRK